MEERAKLLGGDFNVHAKPGEGVSIEASIPDMEDVTDENQAAAG